MVAHQFLALLVRVRVLAGQQNEIFGLLRVYSNHTKEHRVKITYPGYGLYAKSFSL